MADLALHQKDWIQLPAFPQSPVKFSQPEAAKTVPFACECGCDNILKIFFNNCSWKKRPCLASDYWGGSGVDLIPLLYQQPEGWDRGNPMIWVISHWLEKAGTDKPNRHGFLCSEGKLEIFRANAKLKTGEEGVGRKVLGEMATEQACFSYPTRWWRWLGQQSLLLTMVNPQPLPCLQRTINATLKVKQPLNMPVTGYCHAAPPEKRKPRTRWQSCLNGEKTINTQQNGGQPPNRKGVLMW